MQRAAGAADRIAALLRADQHLAITDAPKTLPKTDALSVSFEAVNFAYESRPDVPAVRDVSLTIQAGQRIALVGPSGAGKSTLFHLLLRLYDPDAGQIKLNNIAITDLSLSDLRGQIGLVPQIRHYFLRAFMTISSLGGRKRAWMRLWTHQNVLLPMIL